MNERGNHLLKCFSMKLSNSISHSQIWVSNEWATKRVNVEMTDWTNECYQKWKQSKYFAKVDFIKMVHINIAFLQQIIKRIMSEC